MKNSIPFYDEKAAENYQRELRRRGYTTKKEQIGDRFHVFFEPKVGRPVPKAMIRAQAVG